MSDVFVVFVFICDVFHVWRRRVKGVSSCEGGVIDGERITVKEEHHFKERHSRETTITNKHPHPSHILFK